MYQLRIAVQFERDSPFIFIVIFFNQLIVVHLYLPFLGIFLKSTLVNPIKTTSFTYFSFFCHFSFFLFHQLPVSFTLIPTCFVFKNLVFFFFFSIVAFVDLPTIIPTHSTCSHNQINLKKDFLLTCSFFHLLHSSFFTSTLALYFNFKFTLFQSSWTLAFLSFSPSLLICPSELLLVIFIWIVNSLFHYSYFCLPYSLSLSTFSTFFFFFFNYA